MIANPKTNFALYGAEEGRSVVTKFYRENREYFYPVGNILAVPLEIEVDPLLPFFTFWGVFATFSGAINTLPVRFAINCFRGSRLIESFPHDIVNGSSSLTPKEASFGLLNSGAAAADSITIGYHDSVSQQSKVCQPFKFAINASRISLTMGPATYGMVVALAIRQSNVRL